MKRFSLRTVLSLLAIGLSTSSAFAGGDPPGIDPLIPGRAIIRLPNGAPIAPVLATINSEFPTINASVLESLPSRSMYLLQHSPLSHPALDLFEERLNTTYVNQGLLVYGELLYEGKAPEGSSGSIWVDGVATFGLFSDQYARSRVRLPEAHARSVGAHTVVAVLDTGIDASHALLADRIAPGGYNFLTNSTNTLDVGDGVDNDGDGATDELVGHGTFVSGMIIMTAPSTRLLPVTVLNSDGKGDNWLLVKGLFHAIDRGVEVINLSLTSTYDSFAVIDGILEAASRGIVVVGAAGNWGRSDPREYPAMDDDIPVIGVAATDDNDIKGAFSNYNERLFLSAPGANAYIGGVPVPGRSVVSTLPNGTYAFAQGTSMATPLVSGAAALIRSQHPEWAAAPSTVAAIRSALASTAQNIDMANPAYAGQLGHGRVDVGAAVDLGPIAPDTGDLNNDGFVDVSDLLAVINAWGTVHSSSDIDGDGTVNVDDLLAVLLHWG